MRLRCDRLGRDRRIRKNISNQMAAFAIWKRHLGLFLSACRSFLISSLSLSWNHYVLVGQVSSFLSMRIPMLPIVQFALKFIIHLL